MAATVKVVRRPELTFWEKLYFPQIISGLKEAGVPNLLLNFNVGQMPPDQVEKSMRLFGEKVLPRFNSL